MRIFSCNIIYTFTLGNIVGSHSYSTDHFSVICGGSWLLQKDWLNLRNLWHHFQWQKWIRERLQIMRSTFFICSLSYNSSDFNWLKDKGISGPPHYCYIKTILKEWNNSNTGHTTNALNILHFPSSPKLPVSSKSMVLVKLSS